MNTLSTQDWDPHSRPDLEDPRQRFEGLIQSARINGQRAWLELLRDREEWNASPYWAQDEAIKAVANELGESFVFQSSQVYECGGQSHRIAQFEHRPSTARLNLLPGGSFEMGSDDYSAERPIHRVELGPFLMGVGPLTQRQWASISWTDKLVQIESNRPVDDASWNDATLWVGFSGDDLDLPSEAEWEYACRAGSQANYPFGDDPAELKNFACYGAGEGGQSQEIMTRKSNAFGLFDMLGNVWECCLDNWHPDYVGAPVDGGPWLRGGHPFRAVYRGGCWASMDLGCRSAARFHVARSFADPRHRIFGFRICRRLSID